jgi:3-methylcrotonyl-CoA carboxylase alpha subunit
MTPLPAAGGEARRVLIANRGEIAVRIARAARDAGLVPLGIYSEADRGALHLRAMDDAVCIGPAEAAQSYLNAERILAAAREMRADAVHPGYGFLSERASFARAVRDAGLSFIGPSPEAIAAMGDKSEAKRRVRACGVPVVPGYDGSERALPLLLAEAERIGTPLLIKATAGGGGRGMRVVRDLALFEDALAAARREAAAAFGDDEILLEKYIERPRHIEFQILADVHGTTIHLGERECSIQRRHQKIVEEAPSLALDGELRTRMGAAAVAAARSVAYTNAGTVEFLLAPDGSFYFLEMNARLQVEHPVTELVHDVDLVRWQFALAAGAELTLRQEDVRARGWAIEMRVNAEDPENGYLPGAGSVTRFEPPAGPGVRVDAGVATGSDVGIYYDSLIAKLIVHGETRPAALGRLGRALAAFRIDGVPTNLPLLDRIVRDPDFKCGATTTAYLEEHPQILAPGVAPHGTPALLAIGALLADGRAWRIGGVAVPLRLRDAGRTLAVVASRTGSAPGSWQLRGAFDLQVTFEVDRERVVAVTADAMGGSRVRSAGTAALDADGVAIFFDGDTYRFDVAGPPELVRSGEARHTERGTITSPMPGKIVKVAVRAGERVVERDLLVVLEAMKMEHRIEATHEGVVRNVRVTPGAVVRGGATLVEMEA